MRRVIDPEHLIAPENETIREKAEEIGLKAYAPDLIRDIVSRISGGEIRKESDLQAEIRQHVIKTMPTPDSDGEWKTPISRKWTADRNKYIAEKVEDQLQYQRNVIDFIKNTDFNVPGNTPLEKALLLVNSLSKLDGNEGATEGEPLPIFYINKNMSKEISDIMEEMEILTQEEKDFLLEGEFKSEIKGAEEMLALSDKEIRDLLHISRELNELSKFAKKKSSQIEPDLNGEDMRIRSMKSISELPKIRRQNWREYKRNPKLFMHKALNNGFNINERCTRKEKKQFIYFLIDTSGSMDKEYKIKRVQGILLNRLMAAAKGDCELWLSFFEESLSELHKIDDKETAISYFKKFQRHYYNGGGTNIPNAIKEGVGIIKEHIKDDSFMIPEIAIITDDDDSSSHIKKEDLEGNVLHSFILGYNTPLVELSKASGGIGINNF